MLKLSRRGQKGIWQITGTVGGERYRESTGTNSEPHAQVLLAQRQNEALDRAVWGAKRTTLFAEAVSLYVEQGGEVRFLAKLLDRFGASRMADITQADVSKFAKEAYPNSGPEGIDRQVFTPLIAIFRKAHKQGMCEIPSFERPDKPKREAVEYADDEYVAKLLPSCSDRLKAAVLTISYTAARASEACRVHDPDVNWEAETMLFRKTKGGKPRRVPLAPTVVETLLPLRGTAGPLFGFSSRYSLNQAIERACKRAGLPFMSSHKIGRHSFAARLLRQGKTLKEVQEAGGWSNKSYRLLAEIYGHLEQSQIDATVRSADTNLAQLIKSPKKIEKIQRRRRA
jgi:integrase